MITLLILLFVKHYLFDYVWQNPYMFQNKGILFHPGGLLHAGLHSVATLILLLLIGYTEIALICSAIEFVIHYLTDYIKVNIEKKFRLSTSDPRYWQLFGLDQLIHSITYIFIVLITVVAYI
jgi:hypothetical protein